jgi:hypothetical protein
MGSCVIGARCGSCAISPDHTKYRLWTAAHRLACLHPESRQPYVISEHALCFALNGCASGGVVNR